MGVMANLKTVIELDYLLAKTKNMCKWKVHEYSTTKKKERKKFGG